MTGQKLFETALESPAIHRIRQRLDGGDFLCLAGVDNAAKPFLVALLHRLDPRPILVITAESRFQDTLRNDLRSFHPPTYLFPAWETLPHEDILPHADIAADRLRVLQSVSTATGPTDRSPIVVASVRSVMQRTLPSAHLQSLCFELVVGQATDLPSLVERLFSLGYSSEYQVGDRGDVAMRGGIVDLFPLQLDNPVRIEFFGDEIESIREFDVANQQSIRQLDRLTVTPAAEIGLPNRQSERLVSLLDCVPANTLLVLDDPEQLTAIAAEYAAQLPADHPLYGSWAEITGSSRQQLHFLPDPQPAHPDTITLDLASLDAFRPLDTSAPEPEIAERMRHEFFDQVRTWQEDDGYQVRVFCDTEGELERFRELWIDQFGPEHPTPKTEHCSATRGFIWPEARLVVVTDAEIYGRYKLVRPRHKYHRLSQPSDWTEFQQGDFVVHLQHGIGKFLGLKTITHRGREDSDDRLRIEERVTHHEVLAIEYADQARVYVPLDQAHLVTKYISAGKRTPPLHRLGGAVWQRQKHRAEQAILDLASELLEIQAARATLAGHAYTADTAWQREFEAAFPYEETPDQDDAIRAVKRDMETRKPMDRLICGDVGYGKTEVAIRAAFKAVMDGFQVAVLVPTTILAEQHFNTFRERMAGYPVAIEMLSRFRTAAHQRKIVNALQAGQVDIIIGTHRLLSQDVVLKNLGLVVIDEEQRFGVLHKERFKHLRRLVDVITLSATPIPRTLYLSLTGARDMSTIQTPPQDRLPVETTVAPYDDQLIGRVIRRELDRGGQVFFLHNRVQSIETVAERLRRLLTPPAPDLNTEHRTLSRVRETYEVKPPVVATAHGQMPEHQLEDVMHRFVAGQVDVLVCTTIIESGLDIPNANTIIIDRADRFGLSDLYQLRGRVGRYKHQAYAYMLIPKHLDLVANARKRIGAIRRYSSLGSGFKIAMRDLEIRGAGNVLGPEQSGHISAIGFDLYCQLLKESIARLKNEPIQRPPAVTLKLDFLSGARDAEPETPDSKRMSLAYLPTSYISDPRLRIQAYRRIAAATTTAELATVGSELQDRYGKPPRAVTRLLQSVDLKFAAAAADIDEIETRGEKLLLTRRGQLLQIHGRFPRLAASTAEEKLAEIESILRSQRG